MERDPLLDRLMGAMLRPFDPKKDEPKDVGRGGPSTEVLASEYVAGEPANIPQVWFTPDGQPILIEDLMAALMQAERYEGATGKRFPRYDSIDEAVQAAKQRSFWGGAQRTPLAK